MKKLFQIFIFLLTSQFTLAQVIANFSTKNTDFSIVSNGIHNIVNSTETNNTDFNKIGTPQLPIFSRNYALPQGSIVTNLSIANGSKIEMGGG